MDATVEYFKRVYVALVQDRPYFTALLLSIASLTALRTLFQTVVVLLQTFVLPGTSLKRFGSNKGAWAVVTGATDGIGKEFSFQLAKAGFNIILIARNEQLLSSTADEIREKYEVSTLNHAIDFADSDEVAYEKLSTMLNDFDIGVLVNNVGKSHDMPAYFVDTPLDEISDIISININATLRVTYAVLPGMIRRGRGLILNIGSFAGAVPSPMLATYSGTKAFLATFTSALAEEVKRANITVEHVNTYFVVSKLSKIRKASALIPQPSAYVRAVLSKIGLACGAGYSGRPGTTTPYWSHSLLDYLIKAVDSPSSFIRYTHSLHRDIRRRALKKLREANLKEE